MRLVATTRAACEQIVGRIRVGALPVHGYSVVQRREYWAHSDITGEFFVISLDNMNATEAPVAVCAAAAC